MSEKKMEKRKKEKKKKKKKKKKNEERKKVKIIEKSSEVLPGQQKFSTFPPVLSSICISTDF